MILTLPVLAYQLVFVAMLYLASRFGRTALNVATIACSGRARMCSFRRWRYCKRQ